MKNRPQFSSNLIPWLLLALAAGLYLTTLDTGLRPEELRGGDLITHQYAQVEGRPSNAPGYPLYTMLGWIWFRLGQLLLGWLLNPVQILSLYSTFWGLGSLWLFYQLLYRSEISGRRAWLAALLTLFYAGSYFFWYYSVTTEQYTSAIFQTLLLTWLAFKWEENPTDRLLLAMAFVSGTMLANMLTTLFMLPPLFYLIFSRRPAILRTPGLVVGSIGFGLLPLLSYSYVYIRGAQHPEWRGAGEWNSTMDWFLAFVSTRQGRDELAPGLTWQNLITPEFPSLVWQELTWPLLLAGLLGWALLGRRWLIFFAGTGFIYLVFVTAYRFGNWFQVILPLYPLLLLGSARSIAWLSDWLAARSGTSWAQALLVAALCFLPAYRVAQSLLPNPLSSNQRFQAADIGLDPGWAVLADLAAGDVPESPAVSTGFEEWLALQYLQTVWQAEPEMTLVAPGQAAPFITRHAAEAHPRLIDLMQHHPQALGSQTIYLSPVPQTDLPPLTPVEQTLGDLFTLHGYTRLADGSRFTLYWSAANPISADYTFSLRLWRQGQPLSDSVNPLQQDQQPVWNTYPTRYWQPGEVVVDAYTFPKPPQPPDQLQVVIYRPAAGGFENLAVYVLDLQP